MADLKPIIRGDSYAYELRFKDKETQLPLDTTGWELAFTMKLNPESPDPDLQVVSITSAEMGPTGVISIVLSADQTALLLPTRYQFDFQVKAGSTTRTLTKGYIKVEADVNHG